MLHERMWSTSLASIAVAESVQDARRSLPIPVSQATRARMNNFIGAVCWHSIELIQGPVRYGVEFNFANLVEFEVLSLGLHQAVSNEPRLNVLVSIGVLIPLRPERCCFGYSLQCGLPHLMHDGVCC